jgi:hypothetical protein
MHQRTIECIDPTKFDLADLPTLDLEIQVHKILVKAFASYDELQNQ